MASSTRQATLDPKTWKTAIITGAAQGIGRAIAVRLARDGHKVAIADLKSKEDLLQEVAEEIRREHEALKRGDANGTLVVVITADVTNVDDVKGMVDTVVQKMGKLDIMVANAGINTPSVPFIEAPLSDWDSLMEVNGRGTYLCYRFAADQMVKQGHGGRIVGASSVMGKQASGVNAIYSATKFAIRGLTQAAAESLGKYGITVNAFAPGYTDTPMSLGVTLPSAGYHIPGEVHTKLGPTCSVLGRTGTPEEMAAFVSYVVSDDAAFMTGQTVSINGGMHLD